MTEAPEIEESKGRITLRTGRLSRFRLKDIDKLTISGKHTAHWFYGAAFVAVDCIDRPETEAVQLLANSVGGRLRTTSSGFEIQFRPATFRSRAIETYLAMIVTEPNDAWKTDYRYRIEVLRALGDQQLSSAYATPSSQVVFPVAAYERVRAAAFARLNVRYGDMRGAHESVRRTAAWINENVDFEAPVFAVVAASGKISTRMTCYKKGSFYEF